MGLDVLVDHMGATQGVIGVDSGLSHLAVALGLPHVQLYNFPTSWRTGPLPEHGHHHQRSLEGGPLASGLSGFSVPSVDAVDQAWCTVLAAASTAETDDTDDTAVSVAP
jgi:heptosyltransferase-1